ncbi:RHS repeat-associated core domain-containing protein [Kroppenstedtia guangzhouensis]|uniref:RHS repeat-associated core domain-containing protein n=1 Tax=Kroppenstedtia eburnea TaxID=714067 RepID=A0A1N7LNX3_9BACL|nr:hypothetical protein GXN75_04020 [Kroppenstedtia eburnea]SIS75527.1 RHS repeat-associated core domain-containing protein [Kroppenstedtia eburnea]
MLSECTFVVLYDTRQSTSLIMKCRYDEVTGLYYLQSRYYNPEIGRFLTRDSFEGFEDE